MQKILFPTKNTWNELTKRPVFENENLVEIVKPILEDVKQNGDKAIREITSRIDKVELDSIQVSKEEIEQAENEVSEELKRAIQQAKSNIEKFHLSQKSEKKIVETMQGVECWRISRGIEKVGLYIPGGSAPLFSTILMLGIPAKIAECKEIVLCSPPSKDGKLNPIILYTAQLVGITKVFKVGGAQAIAGMTYGTESIPQVYKIFGPGNQFVTKAKELAQQDGVAIDMPAGPSEVLIIADESSKPEYVAADLLAQAEHGKDSQVVLLSTSEKVLEETKQEVEKQLEQLSRKEITKFALEKSLLIQLESTEDCFEFSNLYAPEHLILAIENAENYEDKITNAGSVFVGNYSCESAGDYASGTNHTLPTNGFAKNYSGVSLDSFVKKITFQKLSQKGIQNLGKTIELMAENEGLDAHKNAVSVRLKTDN
ncbi:MAG: histidinol dehydrogenase [Flavobacteriales bacterium]|nr:histidinol dehydrogenase [Flavobacteriales bacterium]